MAHSLDYAKGVKRRIVTGRGRRNGLKGCFADRRRCRRAVSVLRFSWFAFQRKTRRICNWMVADQHQHQLCAAFICGYCQLLLITASSRRRPPLFAMASGKVLISWNWLANLSVLGNVAIQQRGIWIAWDCSKREMTDQSVGGRHFAVNCKNGYSDWMLKFR